MTIPAGNNWCPSCEEVCHDHSQICTVCGTPLQRPPASSQPGDNHRGRVRAVPDHLVEQTREASREVLLVERASELSRELSLLLRNIHEQIQSTDEQQQDLLLELQRARDAWQGTLPAHWWGDTTQQHLDRSTSRTFLQNLPRILLSDSSSLFNQATIQWPDGTSNLTGVWEAIPGEWPWAVPGASYTGTDPRAPPPHIMTLDHASIVVADPRTGRGGVLSAATLHQVAALTPSAPVIMYMERGDGVTFVQKAMMAQRAGVTAVIMGNHVAEPWPYIMRDSTHEAASLGLTIPVAMIKQAQAQALLQAAAQVAPGPLTCTLRIQRQSQGKECVICTETYQAGQTVIRLPGCSHVFHEGCVLPWLETHHTCPFCRHELPTEGSTSHTPRVTDSDGQSAALFYG